MTIAVDIWLRGTDQATTAPLDGVVRSPREWVDDDVRLVLEGMLRAMYQVKHPEETVQAIQLRGLSWIVSPFEDGGVVIAIEIGMGAAIAGPFDLDQATLDAMVARVLTPVGPPPSDRVH